MTKLPHESWDVAAFRDGPAYKVGPRCANPFCSRYADHAHHLWRRSFTAGDVKWVELRFMDQVPPLVVQNLCGLCHACHDEVTLGKSMIVWDDQQFVWQTPSWAAARLDPQPLTLAQFNAPLGAAADSPASDPHGEHGSAEVCPTCHRPKRKRQQLPPGERRKRKSWNLTVPDDTEDGAEVLDVLCDELSEAFGHDEFTSGLRRYYTVAQAFALVLQHRHLINPEEV